MKLITESRQHRYLLIVLTLLFVGISFTAFMNLTYHEEHQHFIELAQSFLQGHLDLISSAPDRGDVSVFNGKVYWPLGPFPALVLLPFVAVAQGAMSVGLLALPLILLTSFFIFKLAEMQGFAFSDRLWLAFGFLFASPFVTAAWVPRSWQFAHVIVVALMFGALYEYLTRKRLWLIGLLYAGIIATRIPAGLTIIFFISDILWQHRKNLVASIRPLGQLILAPIISVVLLLLYNYARYGMWFEVGYSFVNLGPDLMRMRSYGVLSLIHLPGNIYYFLFASPQPVTEVLGQVFVPPYIRTDIWGVGLLFSAPYLFALIWKRYNDRTNTFLWIAVTVTALPVLMYFSIGPYQQAYRYSLDFLPLVFLIFMRSVYATDKKLDISFKILIALTFFLQVHLYLNGIL